MFCGISIYRSGPQFTGGPGKNLPVLNLPVQARIYRSLQGANTGHNKGHNKGHSKGHNKSTRQGAQQRAQQGAHQDAEQGPFPERYLRGSLRRTITACSGWVGGAGAIPRIKEKHCGRQRALVSSHGGRWRNPGLTHCWLPR